jgi:nucleoid DNA-binding protein
MTRVTDHNSSGDVQVRGGSTVSNDESKDNRPAAATEAFGRQANKGILADRVAQELNVPRRTAARVLDAVLDSIRELLRSRGKVAVKGFGTFERKIRKGRAYKHPLTGKSIEVKDKETILFKPSDQLIRDTKTGAQPKPRRNSGRNRPDDLLFKG